MGNGFSKMKKQARMMQEQLGQMRDNMQNTRIEGSAGGGLVTVVLNGEKEIKSIAIKPETLTDVEALQDLIVAALHDAYKKLESQQPQVPFF